VRLEYPPVVQRDFTEAIVCHEAAGPWLADRFEAQFRRCVAAVGRTPRRFSFYGGSTDYGLTDSEFTHILSAFPLVEPGGKAVLGEFVTYYVTNFGGAGGVPGDGPRGSGSGAKTQIHVPTAT
jgi:hypothetical protein